MFDVRVLIILASLILVVTALAALVAPGRRASGGRVAAGPRRAACRPGRGRGAGPAGHDGGLRPAGGPARHLHAPLRSRSGPRSSRTRCVREVPEGSRLVTKGDKATAAYFILEGEAAAGIPEEDGGYRGLSTMGAGDFFGEIAALTGSPRTADVVATRPSTLMEVPADALRGVMEIPEVNKLLLSTLTERLLRSNQPDLPRLASMDQARAARPAHQGAGRGGAAQGVRRGDLTLQIPSVRRCRRRGDGRQRDQPRGTGRIGYTPTTTGVIGSSDSS